MLHAFLSPFIYKSVFAKLEGTMGYSRSLQRIYQWFLWALGWLCWTW